MRKQIRTDLAMEAVNAGERTSIDGVKMNQWSAGGVEITEVRIDSEQGARMLGKAPGHYVTLECPGLARHELEERRRVSDLLGQQIERLLEGRINKEQPVLVIGLGNRKITPDSLGSKVVDRTLVTRHLFNTMPEKMDERMRSVCALAPGVLGVSGLETFEVVKSLVDRLNPCCLICIDSLAARSTRRVGSAVQLTDTDIQPGSGVGNHRSALNQQSLGVPVLAVGMPMVVYAATIARDALELLSEGMQQDDQLDEALDELAGQLSGNAVGDMIVTPREVDSLIDQAAWVLARGINRALQPALSDEEIQTMME